MEKKIRWEHTTGFKTQVVLALLKGNKTHNEVCSQYGVVKRLRLRIKIDQTRRVLVVLIGIFM